MSEENKQGTGGLPDDVHPGAVFKAGDYFGQYKIIRFLGIGGMGQVYEVHHQTLGTRHALKLINPDLLQLGEDLLKFFRKEARVMAQLNHPGIVRVDDYGEEEGRVWIRQELVDGVETKSGKRLVTLGEYIVHIGGRLPEIEVRECMRQFLDALGFAHSMGCVHRDLKPGNILIDSNGMRITDFGLVRLMKDFTQTVGFQSLLSNNPDSSDRTDTQNALMGTYEYMSPEQKLGRADERSDLYSVGLICFIMLTGQETLGVRKPSDLVDGIDPGWDSWLLKAMAEDADDRFQTATEMADALPKLSPFSEPQVSPSRILDSMGVPSPGEPDEHLDSTGPAKGSLAILFLMILAIAGGFVYWDFVWNKIPGKKPLLIPQEVVEEKQSTGLGNPVSNPGEPPVSSIPSVAVPRSPFNVPANIPPSTPVPSQSVNTPPSPPQIDSNEVHENQPPGTLVGTLSAQDDDPGASLTFNLMGVEGIPFRVEGDKLLTTTKLDFEANPYHKLTIRVTDGTDSSDGIRNIIVRNVNEPPFALSLNSEGVRENKVSGALVGTLSARDPDKGDSLNLKYSLPDPGDVSLFRIDGNFLRTKVAFNFEKKPVHTIRVEVIDRGNLSHVRELNVTIKDANDPPSGLTITKSKVPENQDPGFTVGTLGARDDDVGDVHTFEVISGPFFIKGNKLFTSGRFNHEIMSSHEVVIRITDQENAYGTYNTTIGVVDLIEELPAKGSVIPELMWKDNVIRRNVRVINHLDTHVILKIEEESKALTHREFGLLVERTNKYLINR